MKIDSLFKNLSGENDLAWKVKNLSWLWISLSILFCDQWTKAWANRALIETDWFIFNGFQLNLVHNSGVAFGMFHHGSELQRYLLSVLIGSISLGLLLWMGCISAQKRYLLFAITCILGGAWGNLIDRSYQGYVVDFITIYYKDWYWPTFNVADMAICLGMLILYLGSFENTPDCLDRNVNK